MTIPKATVRLSRSQWAEVATECPKVTGFVQDLLDCDSEDRPMMRATVAGWRDVIEQLGGNENTTARDIEAQVFQPTADFYES